MLSSPLSISGNTFSGIDTHLFKADLLTFWSAIPKGQMVNPRSFGQVTILSTYVFFRRPTPKTMSSGSFSLGKKINQKTGPAVWTFLRTRSPIGHETILGSDMRGDDERQDGKTVACLEAERHTPGTVDSGLISPSHY